MLLKQQKLVGFSKQMAGQQKGIISQKNEVQK